ncbi:MULTISPECIES: hypothetical protein [unclassified Bacillus (in: firmicutes)]|uniref:hypothetical protein n=1 Tax=unclassified Bacillus (in: firmicutes) TaxID=185979 RepID=UPI0008DECB64|nr:MULTISPECIES: hypothetical protein [unclassified Bacillus (in: firmicutes)]SFB04409.1 hypothetical protein SAMN02799634_104293 [Bacillus sp. UNCCL13]SFQ88509.1 hypothetical protein SAMN04488577_3221 [Bacillus sp. cl95]
MSKYISIFFLTLMACVFLFFILSSVFSGGGNPAEEAVHTFGTLIVLLLSFLISRVYVLIDAVKKK